MGCGKGFFKKIAPCGAYFLVSGEGGIRSRITKYFTPGARKILNVLDPVSALPPAPQAHFRLSNPDSRSRNKKAGAKAPIFYFAEREGFEPSEPF